MPDPPRVSVYGKRLDEFSVSQCPGYRRWRVLRREPHVLAPEEGAPTACPAAPSSDVASSEVWERLFQNDVRQLAAETLRHICGESCYKYTGARCDQICRHGFYYIGSLADFRRRRRGKALRNALFVVKQDKYGMAQRHGSLLVLLCDAIPF